MSVLNLLSRRPLASGIAALLLLSSVAPAVASEAEADDLDLEFESYDFGPLEETAVTDEEPCEQWWCDRKVVVNTVAIGGGVGFMAWAVGAWWSEGGGGGFGLDDESFFGQDTYAGGADKLGHMWSAYATARAVTSLYDWGGYDKSTSVLIGSSYSFGILLLAELADGFTDFRFSWEDLLFNAAGAGLGALFELNSDIDDLFDFRIEYAPSDAFKDEGGGINFAEDYSGMRFLLALRFAGVPFLRDTPLRFFDADVGYYTLHYRPDEPDEIPERHFIAGFSLDLAQIVDEMVFPWIDGFDTSKTIVHTIFRYYQPPHTRISVIDEHIQ